MSTKKETFQQNYERLEEIVQILSTEEQDIDKSIELFKEGIEKFKKCETKLKEAQQEVEKLQINEEEADEK